MADPTNATPQDPGKAYRSRIAELKLAEQALQREHMLLGYLRLAIGIAVLVLLFPPRTWAWLPFGAFVFAARVHGAVLQRLAATRRAVSFYEHGLARLEDRWPGLRPRQPRVDTTQSLYAADLDLFGPSSLFELLCGARTSLGEDTLAQWLLAPASIPRLLGRQASVADLRTRLTLREAFAAVRGPALATLDRGALAAWGEHPGTAPPFWMTWLAPVLVLLTGIAAWQSVRLHSLLPFVLMLIVNGSLTTVFRRSFASAFGEAQTAAKNLQNAAALFGCLETETFSAADLQQLQRVLHVRSGSASKAIAQLAALSEWIDARSNYLVRILDAPLLYSLQLALVVRRWKLRYGRHLDSWLEALGECDAMLSLAGYSYEHPADPFPHFVEADTHFAAMALGHPLLPAADCVRNEVALGRPVPLLLVSGSNMSGKSTLLRSVGVNAVLAFAGAPVRAEALSLSRLTLAASIQVNDSLQAGRSRFYAEILRLRAITEAARSHPPVLFLIDELLAGTNSSDRLAGAAGLVNELLRLEAIGMLSTHDLSLTSLAADGANQLTNVHFEDTVENGKLHFDYKLREGVLERSNGLALMRLIGLDV